MVSTQVKIKAIHGLHMRPAGELAEAALRYTCKITIVYGDKQVNGKSLLGVLSLCARHNTELTLVCDGADEQEALAGLTSYLDSLA